MSYLTFFSLIINILFQGAHEQNYFSSVTAPVPLFGNGTVQLLNIVQLFLTHIFSRCKRHNKDSKAKPSNNGIIAIYLKH